MIFVVLIVTTSVLTHKNALLIPQDVSNTLREQLETTYSDLKKVVEDKRKMYNRLSSDQLRQEETDLAQQMKRMQSPQSESNTSNSIKPAPRSFEQVESELPHTSSTQQTVRPSGGYMHHYQRPAATATIYTVNNEAKSDQAMPGTTTHAMEPRASLEVEQHLRAELSTLDVEIGVRLLVVENRGLGSLILY